MKQVIVILLAALFCNASALCACGRLSTEKGSQGNITRDYKVIPFSKIDANTVANIVFQQSADGTTAVQAYGPESLVNLIKVSIVDQTLVIRMEKKNIRNFKGVTITVTSPRLDGVKISGVGNFTVNGLTTDHLNVSNQGVGNLRIRQLTCQRVSVETEGVGNVTLTGKVTSARLRAEGVGNLSAEDLESETVDARSEGVGNLTCWATKELKASSSGIGNIRYKGKPTNKDIQKQGLGNIKEM